MFNKIDRIKDIGSFKDFSWGDIELLRKYNLIFGENGSGKTTITKLLSLLSMHEDIEYKEQIYSNYFSSDSELVVVKNDGNMDKEIKVTKKNLSDLNENIYIFNKDFVDNYVIPCKNFESEKIYIEDKKINDLRKEIKFLEQQRGENEQIQKKINKLFENIRKQESANFRSNPKLSNKRLIVDVKDYIEPTESLDYIQNIIDEKIKEYNAVCSENMAEDIEKVKNITIEEIWIDYKCIKNILNTNIPERAGSLTKKHINKYISNGKDINFEEWLYQGLEILIETRNEGICPLCNSDIEKNIDALIENYRNYYNREYEKLQKKISNEILKLINIQNKLDNRFNDSIRELYKKYSFLDIDLQLDDIQIHDNIYYDISEKIRDLINKLEKKKVASEVSFEISSNDITLFEIQLKKYNKNVNNILNFKRDVINYINRKDTSKDDLLEEIKRLYIKKIFIIFNNEYQKYFNKEKLNQDTCISLRKLKEKQDSLKVQITKKQEILKEEISKLKLESKNINHYLEKLNIYNFRIIFPEEDGDSIEIQYKDNYSKKGLDHTLSEGEKTALAFSYFLSKVGVESKGNEKDRIIIIDDPVSSLDDARLYSIADAISDSFIGEDKVNQLIIFSHNIKFLKIITNYKFIGGTTDLYVSNYNGISTIRNLPYTLKNFNTMYFKKLEEIIDYNDRIGTENEIDHEIAVKYIPNNIRIVLESLLSFKLCKLTSKGRKGHTPGLNELAASKFSDGTSLEDSLGMALIKITDSHSHGSPFNITEPTRTISEDELQMLSYKVVEFIGDIDNIENSDALEQIVINLVNIIEIIEPEQCKKIREIQN